MSDRLPSIHDLFRIGISILVEGECLLISLLVEQHIR